MLLSRAVGVVRVVLAWWSCVSIFFSVRRSLFAFVFSFLLWLVRVRVLPCSASIRRATFARHSPQQKSHFGQVGFASHALPDAGLLRLLACDCRRLFWRRRPRRGLAGWLWSVAAGPDCSTHPPPWRLRHLFPRIRIYHFVACFFSYTLFSRTCSLPCLPPPVFFSSCPVCCGIFAALMGASLGSLDVCVVGEVFNAAGLVARFPPL